MGALLVLLAASPGTPVRAEGFSAPDPGMLAQLRRRHHSGQLLRVTSGAERFELHAQELDERGLVGLCARNGAPPASDPFPWTRVERIDIVTTRTTYGRVMGTIMGGLGGLILPAIPNGYATDKPHQGRDYFFAGAVVGFFAGGSLGSHVLREKSLYVAPIMPAREPAIAAVDSSTDEPPARSLVAADTAHTSRRMGTAGTSALEPGTGPFVQRALRRIDSGTLLRIEGSFGRFHGYASQADTGGLSGLRAEPSLGSVSGLRALRWKEIDRVDARGGSAGAGALRGALLVGGATGVLGAMLGAAIDSYSGSSTYGTAGAMVAGGAIGFGMGAVVGGLFGLAIGAGTPSWHEVYVRP